MRLADLSPATRQKLAKMRYDRIVEKHEGPWDWNYLVNESEDSFVEFLEVDGFAVLLPIDKDRHKNVTIDRCIPSANSQTLTIFLTDATFDGGMFAGYLAVCERFPGETWFVAIVYHECWVSELTGPTNR